MKFRYKITEFVTRRAIIEVEAEDDTQALELLHNEWMKHIKEEETEENVEWEPVEWDFGDVERID